jgi:uncharacterized protein (DUF302 family)
MKTAGIIRQLVIYSVKETIDKLQALIEMNGATIYARIDQQAELKKAGIVIHPLEFLLFGNPVAGGRLMLENPVVALDLPLKIIAWEDDKQQVWLAYNEAAYLQERYALKPDSNSPLDLGKLVSKILNSSIT